MVNDHLVQKWLSDSLTDEEKIEFEALEEASFYKEILDDATKFRASNFSKVPEFDTFKKRISKPDTPVKALHWARPMLRIASLLVIGLGLYYFFFLNELTKAQTLVAQKTVIELPDASQVTLNALSEVRYNEKNWDSKREIELDGEAFFDVAKGARFDVVTPKGTVSVLGTEFNVRQRGLFFEVSCYEGTVRVVTDEETTVLNAGDDYKLHSGESTSGRHVQSAPDWTRNISNFQRMPVSEVLDELQRQYDVILQFEGVAVDQLFTGSFRHDNLENALIAISEPLNLNYSIIKPNTVRLSTRE